MKKSKKMTFNVVTYISLALIAGFILMIAHGANVFSFEFEHASLFMKIASFTCLGLAAIFSLISEKFTLSQNDNRDAGAKIAIIAILWVLSFLFAGYISSEYNNPYA